MIFDVSDLDILHTSIVCRSSAQMYTCTYVASANDLHAGFTAHADPEADAEEAAAGARPKFFTLA